MQKRIALWDNLKLFLIFLVALGHLTIQYQDTSYMFASMTFIIYTFHMPAFIFISGLFSKHAINNDKAPVKKAFGFIVICFFIKILNYAANLPFGKNIDFDFFYVDDVPWYMLAMGIWYLLTWAIKNIDSKYIITVSIVLGCFAGYMQSDADFLCILRVVTFFPFFYLGYISDRETIAEKTQKKGARIFSAIFFISFIVIIAAFYKDLEQLFPLLTGRRKFADLEYLEDIGFLLRFVYYVLCSALIFSIIALCPRKELKISKYGRRTLQIYVYHRPFLYIMKNAGLFYLIKQIGPGWEWPAVVVIILLTALLCPDFWNKPLEYLLHPKEKKEYAASK